MEEKSNIEVLKELARATNRTIVDKEVQYPVSGIGKIPKYRRIVFMPNNATKTSFFIWFSDPYAKIGFPTNFCGAFIPISERIKSKLNIRAKYILDNINFLSKTKANKIGNDYFDSKVIISGNVDTAAKRLLANSKVQHQILSAFEIASFINVSINEYNIDFVPELKNKSYLSIINPQGWDFERDFIEEIFRSIEKLRNDIS